MCDEDELWSGSRYFAESKMAELYDEGRGREVAGPPMQERQAELRLIARKAMDASLELVDQLEVA